MNIKFNIHTKSSELLYKWLNDTSNKELAKQLIELPDTQIMAGIVKNILQEHNLPTFIDELNEFSNNNTLKTDPYGINLAYVQKEKSILLLERVKNYDVTNQIIDRIKPYIPSDYPLDITCNVYFVLTGWEWGDAMVSRVKNVDNKYIIDENGEPIIIINLSIMTHLYSEDIEELLHHISHSISHELFHLIFAKYRDISPYWKTEKDNTEIESLIEIIQNEGIAHYISHNQKQDLIANYDQSTEYKQREKDAFQQLEIAIKQLLNPIISKDKKYDILMKSNAGKFWSKYGAIAGMFIVYHIEKALGEEAIKETVAKGAISFLKQYEQIQTKNPELLPLPLIPIK